MKVKQAILGQGFTRMWINRMFNGKIKHSIPSGKLILTANQQFKIIPGTSWSRPNSLDSSFPKEQQQSKLLCVSLRQPRLWRSLRPGEQFERHKDQLNCLKEEETRQTATKRETQSSWAVWQGHFPKPWAACRLCTVLCFQILWTVMYAGVEIWRCSGLWMVSTPVSSPYLHSPKQILTYSCK